MSRDPRMRLHMHGRKPEIDSRSWGAGREGSIDPGPWGQTKNVTFVEPPLPGMHMSPVTVVRGNLEFGEDTGELFLRTYALGIAPVFEQPAGVGGVNPKLSDVAAVAVVKYGLGGASLEAEINIKRGTMITVPASFWDLGVFIDQVPDMTQPPGVLYPRTALGPKTVQVYCVASLGTHSGGSTLPTRDQYFRAGLGNPAGIRLPIPASAARVTFQGDASFDPTLLTAAYIGGEDYACVVLPAASIVPGQFQSIVPGQATHLDLTYPVLEPETLITITWEIAI